MSRENIVALDGWTIMNRQPNPDRLGLRARRKSAGMVFDTGASLLQSRGFETAFNQPAGCPPKGLRIIAIVGEDVYSMSSYGVGSGNKEHQVGPSLEIHRYVDDKPQLQYRVWKNKVVDESGNIVKTKAVFADVNGLLQRIGEAVFSPL